MSYPILYKDNETNFDHNGIGVLSDCIQCYVNEQANGSYEMEFRYPMTGIHFSQIDNRSIIKAKANGTSKMQLFRVYFKSKPISGIVTFRATHISYDLSGVPVSAFSANSASDAFLGLSSNAVVDSPFTFWTDKEEIGEFVAPFPMSVRAALGGNSGCILDVYGGELEFDNYEVKLHKSRGTDRGFSIRYAKNMTSMQQEENCSNVYTGIYPFWIDPEDSSVFELTERIVYAEGNFDFVRILPVDFSEFYEEKPTEEQLREHSISYIRDNQIGAPSVSLSVSFSRGEGSEPEVFLWDTVSVYFPSLGVYSKAKVSQLMYDSLSERVDKIVVGDVVQTIADTVAGQQTKLSHAATQSDLQRTKVTSTSWLTNGIGYKVERRDSNGMVLETLYLDEPNVTSAKNVMRVGKDGMSFSENGANGPFFVAFSISGEIMSKSNKTKIDLLNDKIIVPVLNGKKISWVENEDGTYSLIGT